MAAMFSPIFSLMAAKKSPPAAVALRSGGVSPVISGALKLSSPGSPTTSHALTDKEILRPLIFKVLVPEEIEEEMEEEDDDLDSDAPTDWKVTPRAHVFEVEVPGLEKEEIKVELEEDDLILTISGEKKKKKTTTVVEAAVEVEEGESNINWVCCERSSGNFTRRFGLPENVKADEVAASLKNGVLTVTVPKAEPKKVNLKTVEISG